MTIDEFEPDALLAELNSKLLNVSITHQAFANCDTIDKSSLASIKHYLTCANPHDNGCLLSVQMIRKYMTSRSSGPDSVDDVLELGILPRLRELLIVHDAVELQFECAWIVTNIAAGNSAQTQKLIRSDFSTALLECLNSPQCVLSNKAQAAWALANFAGESTVVRESLIQRRVIGIVGEILQNACETAYNDLLNDGYEPLPGNLKIYDEDMRMDIKALTWAICNMARGGFHTAEHWETYIPAFQALERSIMFEHRDLWVDSGFALSRILHNMHDVVPFHEQIHISLDLSSRLVQLLGSHFASVRVPILRTIINLTSGPSQHTRRLMQCGLLQALVPLLDTPLSDEQAQQRDAFLIIANVAADDRDSVGCIAMHDVVMRCVLRTLQVSEHPTMDSAAWKLITESLWILCNIICMGSDEHVTYLLDHHRYLLTHIMRLIGLEPREIPLAASQKAVDAAVMLIERSVSLGRRDKDVTDKLGISVLPALETLCIYHSNQEALTRACTRLHSLIYEPPQNHIAAQFGLGQREKTELSSYASKRRILHGLEDGDVRLIENAVGKLSI